MTMLRHSLRTLLMAAAGLMIAPTAMAQGQATKDLIVVPSNQASGVALDIEIGSPTLHEGTSTRICFSAGKAGYATLWNVGTSGRVARIYPYDTGDRPAQVEAGQRYCAGDERASHAIRVQGPYGMEDTYLVWTSSPDAQPKEFRFDSAAALSKDLLVVERLPTSAWATAKVTYEIVPAGGPPNPPLPPAQPGPGTSGRTWVLAMGADVTPLTKTNLDAHRFATQISRLLNVPGEQVRLLRNATRRDFEDGMAWLKTSAAPGDLVFVYFSGHGTTISDDNGDESDQLDEAFVTYDAQGARNPDAAHIVRDDTYARWVNALATDRVVTVIDACHSGGLQKSFSMTGAREKFFIKGALGTAPAMTPISFSSRKNVAGGVDDGVKGVVLAAAQEDQYALELSDGGLFTVKLLETMTGSGTLRTAFDRANSDTVQTSRNRQAPALVGNGAILDGVRLK